MVTEQQNAYAEIIMEKESYEKCTAQERHIIDTIIKRKLEEYGNRKFRELEQATDSRRN